MKMMFKIGDMHYNTRYYVIEANVLYVRTKNGLKVVKELWYVFDSWIGGKQAITNSLFKR